MTQRPRLLSYYEDINLKTEEQMLFQKGEKRAVNEELLMTAIRHRIGQDDGEHLRVFVRL